MGSFNGRNFYPTAFKSCSGIVFTPGDQVGGWAGGQVGGMKNLVQVVSLKS